MSWERLYTECNTERLEYLHQTEQLEATLKAAYAEIKDLRDVAIGQEEKLIDCEIITKRLEAAEAENRQLKESVENLQKDINPEIIEKFKVEWEEHRIVCQPTDSSFNLALRIIDHLYEEIKRLKGE